MSQPGSGRSGEALLGIDLGERRIGVAFADEGTGTAQPLTTLSRGRIEQDAAAITTLALERRAGVLVVGLPLDMDGGEGFQAVRTREWAAEIAARTGLPVRFRDERLTTERATERVGRTGRGRSGGPPSAGKRDAYRARIDREAAALILQDELDSSTGEPGSRP